MKEVIQTKLFDHEIIEDWEFADVDTQYATHGLHPYPARMIPQIARRLIKKYLIEYLSPPHSQYIVFDPFCGSGTVLLEAKLLGVNAIGIDINPLAILIARAKVNPPKPQDVIRVFDTILQSIRLEQNAEAPMFNNIDYWFKPNVIKELSKIKKVIEEKLVDIKLLNFFRVCLSLTARKSSNIYREGDTYIKRMSKEMLEKHNPNVFEIFSEIIMEKLKNIKEFYSICKNSNIFSDVIFSDALSPCIRPNSVDLIVTSPPYGEEKNTVSYTRWSKISLYWLTKNFDSIKKFEKLSLGAKRTVGYPPSPTLKEIIKDIKDHKNLILDAISFFNDYYNALKSMFDVLKRNRYCCIVIGNRSIRQKRIPMDIVTVELAKHVGFKHEQTFYRKLPKKALPWKCGKGETISKENIIILKKE